LLILLRPTWSQANGFGGVECSGGGYGDPLERDVARVFHDVVEGWETCERARAVYGVIVIETDDGDLVVDSAATESLRAQLAGERQSKQGRD
jgi:N-methylhydantoinase B